MAWTPLSSRLDSLPLLLAGPIVRRAEETNVSVWFVLKEDRNVTLNIYSTNSIIEVTPTLSGSRSSGVQIGDHVFVYCMTAKGDTLSTGTNYYYDIDFDNGDSLSGHIIDGLQLTYDGSNRPSFSLPPDNLDQIRLVHGSCRKPHGEGYDALEGVNEMILGSVSGSSINAVNRPHQLFLTGDQIYADDVADVLLFMIDDAARTLFNWDEDYSPFTADELKPGKRNTNNRLRNDVGFTGMLPEKPEYSKSHLLKFREYATMYLFAWSDVLWPAGSDFPGFNDVFPDEIRSYMSMSGEMITSIASRFRNEKEHVKRYKSTITNIRKALANIPVYMIFDDHEITDDWNLNWRWCKEVYSKPLGRRTIQNGLLAFALFQAWGNTPEQFDSHPKRYLLDAANTWRGDEDSSYDTIESLLNIPTIEESASISDFPHHSGAHINWFYSYEAQNYAVFVEDSRTWRHYPTDSNSDINFAGLISDTGFNAQFPNPLSPKEVIIVVSPSPVLGVPFIEDQQRDKTTWPDRCDLDTEAWSLNEETFEKLFSTLASRLPVSGSGSAGSRRGRFAFLSGDVHYGLSARYQLWGDQFINDPNPNIPTDAVFIQLTASSFKNQTSAAKGTRTLHIDGYPLGKPSVVVDYIVDNIDLLTIEALPDPWQRFVWFLNGTSVVGRQRPRTPLGLWNYGPVPSGLLVRSVEQLNDDNVVELTVDPFWRYRVDWILAQNTGPDVRTETTPRHISVPPSSTDRAAALETYLAMAEDYEDYAERWGNGKEIVGMNNIGEVRFDFSGPDKRINHIQWWRMKSSEDSSGPLQIFPLSTFVIPMDFNSDTDHEGNPITEPTYNGL